MKNLVFILIIFISGNSFSQKTIISTTKTNVFYQWLENPLQISVENHSCEELIAKVDKGILKGSKCEYIYVTDSSNITKVKVTIGVRTKKKVKWIDSIDIRVKSLPDPEPLIGSFSIDDTIPKAALLANMRIWLPMMDSWELYGNCFKQDIISFTIRVLRNDSTIFRERHYNPKGLCNTKNFQVFDSIEDFYIVDSQFSREAYSYFVNESKQGDRVIIENIVALLYRQEERQLENRSFILW
ncbi:MAG: hypothetical protein ACKVQB_07220 [Bacteroidia bacterium]